MKTIEERYKCTQEECSNKCPLYHPDAKMCLQHWAIKFATEQKQIDIDKACEWLMKQYVEDDMDMVSASAFINDFRKAMEK